MKKVLLTGFDPFGGESVNPALEAVKRLEGHTIAGHVVEIQEVPTVFDKCIEQMNDVIERANPNIVMAVGQAGGRAHLSIERVAININDARIPDNDGYQPIDTPIAADGPAAYWSTLPIKAIVKELRVKGIPASVSQTAGTFVCNHIFYGLMHHLASTGTAIRGGFIHIPFLPEQAADHPGEPSMALDTIVEGLRTAIQATIDYKEDITTIGGQIS